MAKKTISSLNVILGATVKPFVSAFGAVRSVVTGFVSSIGSASSTLLKFTGIAGLVGAAIGAIKSAGRGISLAAELEQTEVAFKTMLGSADAAKSMMAQLSDFAASTPFEFPGIASSAKSLLAFGIAAGDIPKTLKMVGDVAAGVGVSLEDLSSIYGKAKTQGRLMAEDINQLTGRGIPIIKELAKQFGVSEGEVKKLVEQGKVGFPQLQKAFESMTGPGGQFAGLMEAQSQTLAGLWSTLTDNIGMTLAGLVRSVVDAFKLRDALKALTNGIGSIGGALQGAVARYAPIIVGFASSIWSTVVSVASAIYGYVAPIVASVYGVIANNWRSIVTTTTAYAMSIYNLISAVIGAVWSIVTAIWGGIVAVWTWGCDLLGYQTTETGSTVGNVTQGIVGAFQWMQSTLTTTFNILAFGISNFGTVVQYVGTSAAYHIVRFANVATHWFGVVIDYVVWFGQNFFSLLHDAFWNGVTLAQNFGKNIVAIISNLPGLIAGTTDWSEVLTPLTDGFISTVSALPDIAERIPGNLEAALDAESQNLGDSLANGLFDSLNAADKQAARATEAITGTVNDIKACFWKLERHLHAGFGYAGYRFFILEVDKTESIEGTPTTVTYKTPITNVNPATGTITFTAVSGLTVQSGDVYRIQEPAALNKWKAREIEITFPNGAKQTTEVTHNDHQTLWLKDSLNQPAVEGTRYRMIEPIYGGVYRWNGTKWESTAGMSDSRGQPFKKDIRLNLPHKVKRYGPMMAGDYIHKELLNEIYRLIDRLRWTKYHIGWTSRQDPAVQEWNAWGLLDQSNPIGCGTMDDFPFATGDMSNPDDWCMYTAADNSAAWAYILECYNNPAIYGPLVPDPDRPWITGAEYDNTAPYYWGGGRLGHDVACNGARNYAYGVITGYPRLIHSEKDFFAMGWINGSDPDEITGEDSLYKCDPWQVDQCCRDGNCAPWHDPCPGPDFEPYEGECWRQNYAPWIFDFKLITTKLYQEFRFDPADTGLKFRKFTKYDTQTADDARLVSARVGSTSPVPPPHKPHDYSWCVKGGVMFGKGFEVKGAVSFGSVAVKNTCVLRFDVAGGFTKVS